MGAVDARKKTADYVLSNEKFKCSIVVYPGGSKEIFQTNPQNSTDSLVLQVYIECEGKMVAWKITVNSIKIGSEQNSFLLIQHFWFYFISSGTKRVCSPCFAAWLWNRALFRIWGKALLLDLQCPSMGAIIFFKSFAGSVAYILGEIFDMDSQTTTEWNHNSLW